MAQSGGLERELPETVRTLVEARTGDPLVGSDYTMVYWDEQMEFLGGLIFEDALGKPCYGAVMGEGK